ncbi:hypothetical protein XELAEV_18026265mg [Xenopus laevis]|uniref:Calpain catalytic domain-containing protein n=1 Tax=Xenopus laevis TaxID=8355 RepID=A0A974CVA0_XENLA|nr:hypothetical protein XELAEV_18026265mg [Xenopus laevis]
MPEEDWSVVLTANCGFLSSLGCLTLTEEYLSLVVPQDQSFKHNYAGIFHFRFWKNGEWVDVVVDDRLPTKNKKLVSVKSAEENEFWAALLEKAFAKLRGSYEDIEYKYATIALQNFTGGVCLWHFFKADLFPTIQRAVKAKCLLTCATGAVTGKNLIAAHAYSITGAEEVSYRDGKVQLIRLRNPWGHKEWKGQWSDDAPEWNDVAPDVKNALLTQKEDGEFWISYPDLVKEYESLDICHIAPSTGVNVNEQHWSLTQMEGSWKKGDSAEKFLADPRFRIKLEVPDEDQAAAGDAGLCTLIVALKPKVFIEKVPDFLLYQVSGRILFLL